VYAGQENTDSDKVLKKMFGDLDTEATLKDAEKHQVMRDADNQKIDAVTENKQMGRLTEEAHMDTILNPEPEPEKNGVSHSPKGTLKGLLEEADMEVTLKEVEKPKSDELVQDKDEELV